MIKTLIFAIIMSAIFPALAEDDHNVNFTAQKLEYEEMRITWETTNDVVTACNTMMYKKKFNPNVIACAQRSGIVCRVITKPDLNLAILGHEIRHCYEGAWHE